MLPIYLLHGQGLSPAMWPAVPAHLAPHLAALPLALPGFAGNPHPAVSMPAMGQWLVEALPVSGQPYALVGLSLGANVILEAAASLPPGCQHVVLLAPPLLDVLPGTDAAAWFYPEADASLLYRPSLEAAGAEYLARHLMLAPGAPDHLVQRVAGYLLAHDPARRVALLETYAQGEFTPSLQALAQLQARGIPVQVLLAGQDQLLRPEPLAHFGHLLAGVVELPACGHTVVLENPDGFWDALATCLVPQATRPRAGTVAGG